MPFWRIMDPRRANRVKDLRKTVVAAAERLWPKGNVWARRPGPVVPRFTVFYEGIANLSPRTEAQRFYQNRALAISGSLRHMRALMLEQMGGSVPWPFLAVLIFWIGALFLGFGLFARINTTIVVTFFVDRSAFGCELIFPDLGNEPALPWIDAIV